MQNHRSYFAFGVDRRKIEIIANQIYCLVSLPQSMAVVLHDYDAGKKTSFTTYFKCFNTLDCSEELNELLLENDRELVIVALMLVMSRSPDGSIRNAIEELISDHDAEDLLTAADRGCEDKTSPEYQSATAFIFTCIRYGISFDILELPNNEAEIRQAAKDRLKEIFDELARRTRALHHNKFQCLFDTVDNTKKQACLARALHAIHELMQSELTAFDFRTAASKICNALVENFTISKGKRTRSTPCKTEKALVQAKDDIIQVCFKLMQDMKAHHLELQQMNPYLPARLKRI